MYVVIADTVDCGSAVRFRSAQRTRPGSVGGLDPLCPRVHPFPEGCAVLRAHPVRPEQAVREAVDRGQCLGERLAALTARPLVPRARTPGAGLHAGQLAKCGFRIT